MAVKQLDLKAARDKRRWTMETLAERAGVNKGTISRIEAGEVLNPSYDTVRKLEEALRVPRGSLTFGQVMAKSA